MKNRNPLKGFLFLILAFTFFQCSTQKKVLKNDDPGFDPDGELLIYIQQSPCLGKCPSFEASFFTGKRMVYEGKKYMPLLGKYEFLVPDELTKNLIFQAVKQNVKQVPDSISIPPDVPVTRIWVVINGKMKKMVGWVGSGNETFKNYSKLLSDEVKFMTTDQEGRKVP